MMIIHTPFTTEDKKVKIIGLEAICGKKMEAEACVTVSSPPRKKHSSLRKSSEIAILPVDHLLSREGILDGSYPIKYSWNEIVADVEGMSAGLSLVLAFVDALHQSKKISTPRII